MPHGSVEGRLHLQLATSCYQLDGLDICCLCYGPSKVSYGRCQAQADTARGKPLVLDRNSARLLHDCRSGVLELWRLKLAQGFKSQVGRGTFYWLPIFIAPGHKASTIAFEFKF